MAGHPDGDGHEALLSTNSVRVTRGSLRAPSVAISNGDWLLVTGLCWCLARWAEDEFDEAVDHEADPEVHEQSPVEMVGSVARGRWQMWGQYKGIEQAADDDGGELFEQAARHTGSLGV